MELFLGIAVGLGTILVAILSRSITTLIHELGHAIPALLFTKEEVVVIVGSYGDLENSFCISLGRLKIFLKFNILIWYAGLCQSQRVTGFTKNFLITIGGPIFSLLLSISLLIWLTSNNFTAGQITLIAIFIASAFWDFCVNMYPRSKGIALQNGNLTYNDGYTLLQLLRSHRHSATFNEAIAVYDNGNVSQATSMLSNMLDQQPARHAAEALIDMQFKEKDFVGAERSFAHYIKPLKRKDRDYLRLARIYQAQQQHAEALKYVDQYLYTEFKDLFARNLRGEILMDLNEKERAFNDFKSVIELDNQNFIAANNMGYIYSLENQYEEAEKLINPGLPYLAANGRAQFQAGYHFRATNQREKALACFQKAKALNFPHHGLDHLILDMEGKW